MAKLSIGKNVLIAAKERISKVFDDFPKIYLSFSGGKDSAVMMHLVMHEAQKRGRKIGVLFVDLEAQYKLTIDHVKEMFDLYSDWLDPYWVSLPLNLRNAVSQLCACFVGIRSDESLNRYRTIASAKKQKYEDLQWTTWCGATLFNAYPIYDWKTEDIWIFNGKFNAPYNRLYDRMHQAGLTISQQRICQPYGDDQRKGLWLFHIIEPETWGKIVNRVSGANHGALYIKESGNILGQRKITKPDGISWREYAEILLSSMPPATAENYKNKISVFIKWYKDRGYPDGIPDEGLATDKKSPSWTRICKSLLRNDYWCKGLSFSQHKTEAFSKYQKLMKKRRAEWGLI
jgi:predicted phosphoadenosine phosphosulfate sulfurtransferase